VEKSDVAFQILLRFLEDPSFEVDKVECVWVIYLFCFQPFNEKWEMIRNFFPVENSIDHMTTEQPHLNFVSCVRVNFTIFMDRFEDVRSC